MLLNINKPVGPTSHDIVDKVRKITGERRVGHAGTLDPFAEGVLIVGVGRESTKKLGDISKNTKKEYIATLELGKTSSTGDPEGEIKDGKNIKKVKDLTKEQALETLNNFLGKIEQTPPQYSAIKINGKPAYKYAREGKKVDIPKRTVEIYELEMLEFNPPKMEIRVLCSSGTYIRTLAEDIGKTLGVGAYLTKLVRTKVGEYKIESAKTLEDLEKSFS